MQLQKQMSSKRESQCSLDSRPEMHCGSEDSPPLPEAAHAAHDGRPGTERNSRPRSNPLKSTGGPTRADLNVKSPESSQLE